MSRPNIPQRVRYELWARAAGRCEFRGCNRIVYLDDVTMDSSNLGWLSHIVAASSEGPRGDPIRSPELATDISNLMLTCRDHGKVIDDSALVHKYPEELLKEFKQEHETRVRALTGVGPESRVHAVIVQMALRGVGPSIPQEEAHRALLPLYPAEEKPRVIDLADLTISPSTPAYLQVAAAALESRLRSHSLTEFTSAYPAIALFALGPIPLLAFLGYRLGHLRKVHLFQRHPESQSWCWPERAEDLKEFYEVELADESVHSHDRPVALVLSTSSTVGRHRVEETLKGPVHLYEIRAACPTRDFLASPSRLAVFGIHLREVLEVIRTRHTLDQVVHVFAAVQAPVAIELGRNLRPNDAPFQVYEYDDAARRYGGSLIINKEGAAGNGWAKAVYSRASRRRNRG